MRQPGLLQRFEILNYVGTLGVVLQANIRHVGPWDHRPRVGEVFVQRLVGPVDVCASVGGGVAKTLDAAGLAADHAEQTGANIVRAGLGGVASAALDLEHLRAGSRVTRGRRGRRHKQAAGDENSGKKF